MGDFNFKKFEAKTRKLFRIWSRFYDSWPIRIFYFEWVYKKITQTVEREASSLLGSESRFLDVACGTGEVIFRLASKYPKVKFTGVDFSEEMIEKARSKNARLKNVEIIQANAGKLPFDDVGFDVVLSSDAFHHFADTKKVLAEVNRVSKPRGLFFLVDPAVDTLLTKIVFEVFVKPWDVPNKYYSRKEIAIMIKESGLITKETFAYFLNNFFICEKA